MDDKSLQNLERKLDQLIALKVHELRGDQSQKDMIVLLDQLRFSPSEIARLLSTSPTSVNPVLSRERKRKDT